MSGPLIMLAAGGTGGHVFPAEALLAELEGSDCRLALVTDQRGRHYGGRLGQVDTLCIQAGGIAGVGLLRRLLSLLRLELGAVQAGWLIWKMKPSVIVGFGGYAALPTVFAGALLRRPTLIHEQNAVLGRANRLLGSLVDRVALGFANTERLPASATSRTVVTGNPVRPAFLEARAAPYTAPGAEEPFRLFIMGGSQGAHVFSSVLPDALGRLPDDLRDRVRVVQQCRGEDLDTARAAYDGIGIDADLRPFFDDVPNQFARAHLIISRSGASSISEITVMGRPAILVPYPHAIDDHQTANARGLDKAGGGWLIPQEQFTAQALAARLQDLMRQPQRLEDAAKASAGVGMPDAARRLAETVLNMTGGLAAPGREVAQ